MAALRNSQVSISCYASFHVKSGVQQGCVMSMLLFNIVINWVLSQTTKDRRREIHQTLSTVLENLYYADDIALLLRNLTVLIKTFAPQMGLKINPNKREVLSVKISAPLAINIRQPIQVKQTNWKICTPGEKLKTLEIKKFHRIPRKFIPFWTRIGGLFSLHVHLHVFMYCLSSKFLMKNS